MNSLVPASNAWLVDFHLAATLLLLVVLIAMRFIKQPARRLAIAWAVVLGLPALAIAVAVPCWPRVSLVSHRVNSVEPLSAPEAVLGTHPIVEPNAEPAWDTRGGRVSAFPVQLPHDGMDTPTRSELSPVDAATAPLPAPSRIRANGPLLFLALFASGSVASIVWLLLGVIQASILCRSANGAPLELLAELKALVGCERRTPRLRISSRVQNPVAVGLFRPTILLPERLACEGITPGLRAALAHEWTHIRNRDLWLLAVCRDLRLILFAHPLFWVLQRSIRADQEALADAAAAEATGSIAYAEALLRWARGVIDGRDARLAPLLGLWERPSRSQLARRIAMLLDDKSRVDRHASRRWTIGWAVVLVVSVAGLSFFTLRPADAISPSDAENVEGADPLSEHVDQYGDPMPNKAVLRLGTRRLRDRGRTYFVAFSPDGQTMATFGDFETGAVSLWSVQSGKLIRRLRGADRKLRSGRAVAFSPDGSRCLAVECDATFHLWDVRTGKEILTFEKEGHPVRCLAFASDGTMFASGGEDGFVHVWRANTADELFAFDTGEQERKKDSGSAVSSTGPRGPISVAFSPDGRFLVSGTEGAKVHVLDLRTGKTSLRVKKAHDGGLTSIAVTPDGRQLITGGYHCKDGQPFVDGRGRIERLHNERYAQIRLWDMASGRQVRELRYEQPEAGYGAISLSADGMTLASSCRHTIQIWNLASGEMLRAIPTPGPRKGAQDLAISPDGRIVARTRHHTADLWDVATGNRLLPHYDSHAATVGCVAYSSDGSLIATGGGDGIVYLWDSKTGKRIRQHRLMDESSMMVWWEWPMLVAFSPDGGTLAVGGEIGPLWFRGVVKLWDTANGEPIAELSDPVAHYRRLTLLEFRPNGKELAVAAGNDIDVWDLEYRVKSTELRPPSRPEYILAVAFLDSRTLCEVRSQPPTIRIWDTINRETREIEVREHWPERERRLQQISDAVFSPDRRQVITCGEDKLVTWDLETGKTVSSLALGRPSEDRRIALSPDGRLMAVVAPSYVREDGDDTIRLWDLTIGKQVLTLQPENTRAVSFAFSPDGLRLVTGMDTGTALVWDISDAYGG